MKLFNLNRIKSAKAGYSYHKINSLCKSMLKKAKSGYKPAEVNCVPEFDGKRVAHIADQRLMAGVTKLRRYINEGCLIGVIALAQYHNVEQVAESVREDETDMAFEDYLNGACEERFREFQRQAELFHHHRGTLKRGEKHESRK